MLILLAALLTASPAEDYLHADFPPADGFSAPFDAGCEGAGSLRAIGNGRVLRADSVIELEHLVYENASRSVVRSSIGPVLKTELTVGQVVSRGQQLGEAAQGAKLKIHGAKDACAYLSSRGKLFVPQEERALVVVDSASFQTVLYENNKLVLRMKNGFGQEEGAKLKRGDNRTPRGMYFVTFKSKGPFTGPVAPYFGGHWIKINYPNAYDAERGVAAGWISPTQLKAIKGSWESRLPTNERTALGGGIGFHGWAHEWAEEVEGRFLSWGCIVLHLRDLPSFYERVPVGAMVVLL